MDQKTRSTLVNALTTYDRKQSTKRGYNRYALGIYFQALEGAAEMMAEGEDLRSALIRSYNGRLCDNLLRAVNLPIMSESECKTGIPSIG